MKKFSMINESLDFGGHLIEDNRILYQDSDYFIMYDNYPTSPGHILIITNGNEKDYFELSYDKKVKLGKMIEMSRKFIEKENNPDGYNIGMNCGESAGQTVMQFHCHVIPRYKGDVENPRGGVRHSVIGKGYY
jgi:diadenosine tetraphosphate (Ap4A) HIT family hydrolase